MDDIIGRIKEYALVFNSNLEEGDLLDLIVEEIVDRVLIYTNRQQFVAGYEEDIVDITVEEDEYIYPIPLVLEKPIARVVVQVYRTFDDNLEGKDVKSIKDQGQSITFSDEVQSYLSDKSDTEIFMSIKSMLDKFRVPTIVETT
jgi:hypothetical protein